MPELAIIGIIVFVFSCVQSVFGMGLLVFGTPTLLLLDYNFSDTLGILLPSSLAISCTQVFGMKISRPAVSKALPFLCLPAMGLSLWMAIAEDIVRHIYLFVAVALIFSAAARILPRLQSSLKKFIVRNLKIFHVVMGIFHGLTNMGGALVAIMAVTIHEEKVNARFIIAVYYTLFVAVQISVLLLSNGLAVFYPGLILMPISLAVYTVLGFRLFGKINNQGFEVGMTALLFLYAVILIVKWSMI